MKCQRVRSLIALGAGDDLSEHDQDELQRHLACCPHCREYSVQMRSCVQSLQDSAELLVVSRGPSLWDNLSVMLTPPRNAVAPRAPSSQFNGWIPALALGVACLLIISLTGPTNRQGISTHQRNFQNPVMMLPVAEPVSAPDFSGGYAVGMPQPSHSVSQPTGSDSQTLHHTVLNHPIEEHEPVQYHWTSFHD